MTIACLASAIYVVLWALSQPSLGLDFAIPDQGEGLVIIAADAPERSELVGARLVGLAAPGGRVLGVDRRTLVEEPDKLNDGALIAAFRADQGALHDVLRSGQAELHLLGRDGAEGRQTVPVSRMRPLSDLPVGFWAQVLTGVAGMLIGGWIWAMNPRRASHAFLFLTAVGLHVSAQAAALYSSRELALSQTAFEVLSPLNMLGALTFGGGLIGLFLSYPRRLLGPVPALLPMLLLLLPMLAEQVRGGLNPVFYAHVPIVLALAGILVLLVVQRVLARRDPMARAALKLVALGIVVGAGGFVIASVLPALLGLEGRVSQAASFPLFLLVFAGVALAVRRYRFFDLERWSFRLLYYVVGGVFSSCSMPSSCSLSRPSTAPSSERCCCSSCCPTCRCGTGWRGGSSRGGARISR
ncbi:hypothetical protein [Oceanicola sp. S124]|uniref:hypothetical protein n=1 Tax=Oceanicola sp. S124 TaxID=1042378 RepID=UPI000301B8E3|nr:hypothetical protein [Oceanicola sp. S124]